MDDLAKALDLLQDCGVQVGNPEGRRELATAALKLGPPQDLEHVVALLEEQTASEVHKLPKLIASFIQSPKRYKDAVESSKRVARRRLESQGVEPGKAISDDNMANWRRYPREEQAALIWTERCHIATEEQRQLCEEGARAYGHPCPKLAAHLLMKEGGEISLHLWTWWYLGHKFKTDRSRSRALDAERLRTELGFSLEDAKDDDDDDERREDDARRDTGGADNLEVPGGTQ